jgi:3-hydroxyacyl-CoA dehydrogenase
MKLVEIISTQDTEKDVISTLNDFVKKLGKVPVACKDTPG